LSAEGGSASGGQNSMSTEVRACQNCRVKFSIDSEDQAFYKNLQIPPPTFCPECRMIRRMMFRNERALYKRNCGLCKKPMISMYAPDTPYVAYCIECYQSDKWDPLEYGRDYDFSKSFFEQFGALMRAVPRRTLYQDFAANSDYTNWAVYLKNCYLVFGGHHYEDCYYAAQSFFLKDCYDVDFCKKSEECYGSVHLRQCSKVHFSLYSEDCTDSYFLYGCRNCHHCVGCTNLRNKSYCIFNEQYSKEEYEKKLRELNIGSYKGCRALFDRFLKSSLNFPRKYAWIRNTTNSTGDDLEQTKNCHFCFSASEDENCRYSFFVPTGAKDTYDADHVGLGTELSCELMSGFNNSRVMFGNRIYDSHDVQYSDDCYHSANLFGCISLRKKEYCILNKQYSKETYEELRKRIVEQMKSMPYSDRKERLYQFGEFFPPAISPFAYNETVSQEYFPITKAGSAGKGFDWRDPEEKHYQTTRKPEDLPDNISDASDNITEQIIGCAHGGTCNEQCTTAFKILKEELRFLQKMNLPLPRLCPNCRHYERLKLKNPLKLWHRKCSCKGTLSENGVYKNEARHFHETASCPNELETSYAPERAEIIYCEPCYQAEVA